VEKEGGEKERGKEKKLTRTGRAVPRRSGLTPAPKEEGIFAGGGSFLSEWGRRGTGAKTEESGSEAGGREESRDVCFLYGGEAIDVQEGGITGEGGKGRDRTLSKGAGEKP